MRKFCPKYANLQERHNIRMHNMEIQVLTEFQLKITNIGEAISENIILAQIGLYFTFIFTIYSKINISKNVQIFWWKYFAP